MTESSRPGEESGSTVHPSATRRASITQLENHGWGRLVVPSPRGSFSSGCRLEDTGAELWAVPIRSGKNLLHIRSDHMALSLPPSQSAGAAPRPLGPPGKMELTLAAGFQGPDSPSTPVPASKKSLCKFQAQSWGVGWGEQGGWLGSCSSSLPLGLGGGSCWLGLIHAYQGYP